METENLKSHASTTSENLSLKTRDKLRIAYIDEPPFYWTGENNTVKGSDIELAEVVLRALGVTSIEYQHTTFEELLPGVQAGRWDMNVPIFITPERTNDVAFSIPVWALGDGFVVHRGNPKGLVSYETVIKRGDARLGVIPGQVEFGAAKKAGMSDNQLVIFNNQPDAVAALLAGDIDAFAATAVGNRAIVEHNRGLEAVSFENVGDGKVPFGGLSFSKTNHDLLQSVNAQLRKYLGSADHRTRMAKYGITKTEIDSVVANKGTG